MRILIIEDDRFFQNFYSSKLKEAGYQVETADNGSVGLESMKTLRPDIVLLDLIMPEKDGFQVLTEKNANTDIAQIPVIVFSSLGQEEDVKKALALGGRDFVNKTSFDFEALKTKIQALVPR